MKIYFILSFITLLPILASSQTAIEIADNTFKIGALEDKILYYGFAEGDKLVFNFEEANGKELKELEISEWPSLSRFMDYKTKKVEDKVINVLKTGIYKFRFANSSLAGRVCKVKIKRISAVEKYNAFDPTVYWKTVTDTAYQAVQQQVLQQSDTSATEVYSSIVQISSVNALNGNKPYLVIDIPLPENTKAWSLYIATGLEGQKEYERARERFLNAVKTPLAMLANGHMAYFAITGISYFAKIQGEDNVKYWVLRDQESASSFRAGGPFYQIRQGDVLNETLRFPSAHPGMAYIGLKNDNVAEPIKVTVKATAVLVKQQWDLRTVQQPIFTRREQPYLKN